MTIEPQLLSELDFVAEYIEDEEEEPIIDEEDLERQRRRLREAVTDEWLTDLGNSMRFVNDHKDYIRYCAESKRWLIWDGCRWAEDVKGYIVELAKQTVADMWLEAQQPFDTLKFKWALASQTAGRITSIVNLAKTETSIAVSITELDTHPTLLNCPNGTVDLVTGELREHRKDDLLTKVTGVEYQPEAECPMWMDQLRWMFKEDESLVTYVQRLAGYSLLDTQEARLMVFVYGQTAGNGKSTLLDAIYSVYGNYAGPIDPAIIERSTFKRSAADASPDLASLKGLRYAMGSELRQDTTMDEQKVKRLTSVEPIQARFLRGNPFTFRNTATFWLSMNDLPKINAEDQGVWDRIKPIPCTARIFDYKSPEEIIDDYAAILVEKEGPGILAWAVRGCVEYQHHKLQPEPKAVVDLIRSYREAMDYIKLFIDYVDECGEDSDKFLLYIEERHGIDLDWEKVEALDFDDPEFLTLSKELQRDLRSLRKGLVSYQPEPFRKLYNDWAARNECPKMGQHDFKVKLESRGWTQEQATDKKRTRHWQRPKSGRKVDFVDLARYYAEHGYPADNTDKT